MLRLASLTDSRLRGGEINVTDTRTQTSAEIAQLRGAMVTLRRQ
jgi:hypothetical protein